MVTKHMAYHIWPCNKTDNWKWNVQHLLQHIHIFDGVRSVAIVKGPHTEDVEKVKTAFNGHRIDNWIINNNIPELREGVTFVPLMNTIKDHEGITWYGHAKGVRYEVGNNCPLIWAHVMYKLTLGHWQYAWNQLQQYPITGCFKRYSDFTLARHYRWHYSGTFYWFRNDKVFTCAEWSDIAPRFFAAIEAWPARLFGPDESACMFGEAAENLYDVKTWKQYVEPLKKVFNLDIGQYL